ncbi:DnaJ-like protein [Chitinophaga dinghuensis]|uniref:DnaJ-like protein n=1 Tax=Chitinophaga dinghuensis TaxID=1539050 RepID=A0A327W5V9_9BACT|nr:DnaJ domain-containing protein [Chitinophaga dinghuensis]RAJ80368.1 DnaJ-like protein [Chitinophaga dinghuensis]
MNNYYQVLGVSQQASPQEIKAAYRSLSKKYHPDKNGGEPYFEEKFKELQRAYEVLSDPGTRQIFDNYLNEMEHPGSQEWAPASVLAKKSSRVKTIFIILLFSIIPGILIWSQLHEAQEKEAIELRRINKALLERKETKTDTLNQDVLPFLQKVASMHRNQEMEDTSPAIRQLLSEQRRLDSAANPAAFAQRERTLMQSFFKIGTAQEDVLKLQGRPTAVDRNMSTGEQTWHYGEDNVTFKDGRVTSYDNVDGRLKVK